MGTVLFQQKLQGKNPDVPYQESALNSSLFLTDRLDYIWWPKDANIIDMGIFDHHQIK